MDSNVLYISEALSQEFTEDVFVQIGCHSFHIAISSGYVDKTPLNILKWNKKGQKLLEMGHKMATNICAIIIWWI